MGQRKSPQPEIGSSVRNTSQTEFDGVNDLVDNNLAEVVLFLSNNYR